MLNRIQIWRLWRPLQHLHSLVFEPLAGETGGMFGIVVLLEDDLVDFQLMPLEGLEELVVEDVRVELCVHPTIDAARVADALSRHTAPHHQAPTAEFDCALDMMLSDRTPWLLPHPLKPIRFY